MAQFDQYARDYEAALAPGLSATGETLDYFAQKRVDWLCRCLQGPGIPTKTVLDYGCGTGSAAPWLMAKCNADRVVGVDVSTASLVEANDKHSSRGVTFYSLDQFQPAANFDLAFCNGVFHHITPPERPAALDYIARALRPGGLFAFWENNPWNPGTRYVMSRIALDKDAIPLNAWHAKRMLQIAGFEIVRTDFLFIFPRALHGLRPLERVLCKLPLGGQYQILCRKPAPAGNHNHG